MGVVGGPVIYYGRCRGGPFNTRHLAHATTSYRAAIDKPSRRPVVGLQAVSAKHPDIEFGYYNWNETTREWDWDTAETAKAVHK